MNVYKKLTLKRDVLQHTLLLLKLEVVLAVDVSETPLARDNDLLATRELVTRTAESLLDDGCILVFASNRKDDLANVHTGDSAVRLAPRATHTGLKTRYMHKFCEYCALHV